MSPKVAVARRPDGRIDGPKLSHRIHRMRLQGLTGPQIAQRLGLPQRTVHYHMQPPEFWSSVERLIRPIVLAAELKIDAANLRQTITALEIPTTTYGRHVMISEADAQRLREHYAGHIDAHTAKSWWTIEQVGRALHLNPDTVRRNMKSGVQPYASIRRARVLGASGNVYRYDPYTVQPIAATLPVQPITPPRGSLTSTQVADALGLSFKAVNFWVLRNADCPARKTQHGIYYWPLVELIAWLSARPTPHMCSYAKTLQQKRAA